MLITHYTRILATSSRTSCTCSPAAGSSSRAAPSSPTSWRTRATCGTPASAKPARLTLPEPDAPSGGRPMTDRPRTSTWPLRKPTSRSCSGRSATGSRWSTSTRRDLADARGRCSTPSASSSRPHNAAVHRGAHQLAEEATDAYEGARAKDRGVRRRRAGRAGVHQERHRGHQPRRLRDGQRGGVRPGGRAVPARPGRRDRRHRDGAPRQPRARGSSCAQRTGATLRWFGVTDDGRLDLSDMDELITERTKVVAFTHQSNVLGTVNPVAQLVGAGPGRSAR